MAFRDDGPLSIQELNKIMRDPSTSNSRIFIGNLPPRFEKPELEDKFSQHGKIIGVVMNRGFAFVQYADEASAAAAISAEAGQMVYGRKLDVKPARVGAQNDKGPNQDMPPDMMRDRSPMRGGPPDLMDVRPGGGRDGRGRDWRDRDRFDGPPGGFGMGRGRGGMDREPDRFFGRGDPFPRDDFRGGPPDDFRGPPDDFRGPPDDFRGPPDDFRGPPDDFRGPPDDMRGPPGRDFGGPPFRGGIEPRGPIGHPGGSGPLEYPPAKFPVSMRTNDCEIIVVNKICTDYAESIERRLKKVGLTVDLLFPNEEVPLGRVLANISGRGTLYAIVITPVHEERRSLTLNILYGQPQEHRNMPVEIALTMISRNFDAYMRGEKGLGPGPVSVGGMVHGIDRHPEAIQTLLNLLKENRQLTVLQYDKVIRYLQDKREVQVKLEVGDAKGLPAADLSQPTTKQQEVLQHRILNILNQTGSGSGSGGDNSPAPVPVPSPWAGQAPPSGGSGGAPLLNDPTVQKALDSLIQGDLLRKINPGAPATNSPQPLFNAYAGQRKF